RLERAVDRREAREREVERAFGQRPEILVSAGERQRPGVFELLDAPDLRQAIGVRPRRRAMAADRGMNVEQGAVGVEYEDRHGCPPVCHTFARVLVGEPAPTLGSSPRPAFAGTRYGAGTLNSVSNERPRRS